MHSLYIRINRTASQSIINSLTEPDLKNFKSTDGYHLLKKENQSKIKEAVHNKYFIFASTRNPYDRSWSCYQKLLKEKRIRKKTTFKQFLETDYIKDEYDWAHSAPITTYLFTWIHLINFWIRYENIYEDFNTFCNLIKVNKKLKYMNVSLYKEEKKCKLLSDRNIRKLIEKKYEKDFNFFGYKKWKEPLI
jgi:hypothetical protein